MKSIRKGCFETNSSSMHSLAIWKKTEPYDNYQLKLGECSGGVFELFKYKSDVEEATYERYPFRILKDPIDKLRYLAGYYYRDGKWRNKEIKKQLETIIKAHVPGCKRIQWHYLDWTEDKKYAYTTYNNDSGEFPIDFLRRKNISLEDFIFNPKYTLQIDGDEYQVFADMFKNNMINTDNIEDISSGLEYWTENYCSLWVEDAQNISIGDFNKTYLDTVEEDIKNVDFIWVYEMDMATEEDWKLTAEFLSKYKDTKIVKLVHINHKEWARRYLPWGSEVIYVND